MILADMNRRRASSTRWTSGDQAAGNTPMPRVFIGLVEIANLAAAYADGFRTLGCETLTVVWSKNRLYPTSLYDLVVDGQMPLPTMDRAFLQTGRNRLARRAIMYRAFLHALSSCDLFVFIFGTSFLPRYWDYAILKSLGKRIVSVFCGSDVRYWYAYNQWFRSLGLEGEFRSIVEDLDHAKDLYLTKFGRVKAAERYSDLILSQPSMAQLQTRPYMRLNLPLNLSQLRFHVPGRKAPVILHAPSNRAVKGTKYVLAAIEQLKREGLQFDFHLVEGMPNHRVREILANADIVVDQLMSISLGTLALEAMATGNAVLARYLPELSLVPPDCPVVNARVATIADKLRELIQDRELRCQLALAGRPWVEQHHSHGRVVQQILDWLKPGGIQDYDFVPTFFRNEFSMPPELLKEEQKRRREQQRQRFLKLLFSRT